MLAASRQHRLVAGQRGEVHPYLDNLQAAPYLAYLAGLRLFPLLPAPPVTLPSPHRNRELFSPTSGHTDAGARAPGRPRFPELPQLTFQRPGGRGPAQPAAPLTLLPAPNHFLSSGAHRVYQYSTDTRNLFEIDRFLVYNQGVVV